MSGSERIIKKREARIKQRKNERQELFMSDYVKHQYKDIYGEATQVYQILNKNYSDKYDIRKTEEHKAWKKYGPSMQHPAHSIRQPPTPPKTHEKHSGLTTQTLEVITEETLQTDEQYDPKTGEQLLVDLNNDPVWKDILDSDGMDIGLDIEIDNHLQNYLETCQFW